MSFPDDVPTFTLTFGAYWTAIGRRARAGVKGTIRPSRPVAHVITGDVILTDLVRFTLDENGAGSVGPLPHTGLAVLSPQWFTYTVTLGNTVRRIAVPVEAGPVVDYDRLIDSPESPGTAVPVVIGQLGSALLDAHVNDPVPHPAYDDLPSLTLIFENGLV